MIVFFIVDCSTFPKRTNDLPPLEPESDSDSENNEPNTATIKVKPESELEKPAETRTTDKKHFEEKLVENEKLDEFTEMSGSHMLGQKSVLKRTLTTPSTVNRMAMLKYHSKSEGVLQLGNSTSRKKSPARLLVVRSFAPPKNLLSARQLFTSDGREILGDSKKTMLTIKNTPAIFRGLLATRLNETLENSSISPTDELDHSPVLDDTILNDEPHYSRIFDVSVAVERSLPEVDMEQFSRVLEERRPQMVERVAELGGGMLQEVYKAKKGVEKLALTPKYKDRLKPHPLSPFNEPQTPPFAVPQMLPPPPKKIVANSKDEKKNMNNLITIEGKRYLLCRNLGKGGSGYVYEGCVVGPDTSNGKKYAIKVIFHPFQIVISHDDSVFT